MWSDARMRRIALLVLAAAPCLAGNPAGRPGYLGAQLEDATAAGGKVVRIVRVLPDSPAAAGGLREGDLVARFGDVEPSTAAIVAAIREAGAGAKVEIEILRGAEKPQLVQVTLGVHPQALLEEPDLSPGMLAVSVERDHSYVLGDAAPHERHKLNLFLPQTEGAFPIVLWIHAGAWSYGDRGGETAVAMRFAERGVGFAAMSYRLSSRFWNEPAASKEGFRHPAHAEDCAMAFAWLRKRFPGSPLFLSGHSCGAHLAALLALDPRYLGKHGLGVGEIRGVVAIGGGYDLVKYHAILRDGLDGEPGLGKEKADAHLKWIFGDTEADWVAASPVTHLKGCRTPMLVVAEREPSMVRYTRDFEDAAKALGITSIRFRYMDDRTHGQSTPLISRKAADPVRDEAIAFIRDLSR
jgi:acetyl esterase/lipase